MDNRSQKRSYGVKDQYCADFLCRVPTIEDMEKKWDYEISNAEDPENWIAWKKKYISYFQKRDSIPYYGFLNGNPICEATAMLNPDMVQNSENLVSHDTVYLCAFRTVPEYQGKGYFSKLFQYMMDDLRERGFKRVTLGVEPGEQKNRDIYHHYGFTQYVKRATEVYPDGTTISVDYYAKNL